MKFLLSSDLDFYDTERHRKYRLSDYKCYKAADIIGYWSNYTVVPKEKDLYFLQVTKLRKSLFEGVRNYRLNRASSKFINNGEVKKREFSVLFNNTEHSGYINHTLDDSFGESHRCFLGQLLVLLINPETYNEMENNFFPPVSWYNPNVYSWVVGEIRGSRLNIWTCSCDALNNQEIKTAVYTFRITDREKFDAIVKGTYKDDEIRKVFGKSAILLRK